jgi:hypothetical protein
MQYFISFIPSLSNYLLRTHMTSYQIFFLNVLVALKRAVLVLLSSLRQEHVVPDLLGRRVLGDGLGSLTDGVLGQFSGQEQTNSCLDLATRDRRTTVVVSETGSLGSDAFEDVVDKAVHDAHGLRADASVGVHLLQDFVDVDGIGLSSSPLLLFVPGPGGLGLGRCFLRSFACCCLRWHDDDFVVQNDVRLTVAVDI